jgi:glycosyltransferase involved in cell wall biosynthesis
LSTPAILYLSAEYDPSQKMMGRQVASSAFLSAVARYEPAEELAVAATSRDEVVRFRSLQRSLGAPERRYRWIRWGEAEGLHAAGGLYRPDPVLGDEAWTRQALDPRSWCITGVTHTVASLGVQRAFAQMVTAPLEPWDALICTSEAVRRVVEGHFEALGQHLAERWRMPEVPRVRLSLPVIPLGVHLEEFDTRPADRQAARQARRAELGVGEDDVVVLFVGRLAWHAKANPWPMYAALEAAARRTGKVVHLVQAGWFAGESLERGFRDAAALIAPTIRHHFIDGREPAWRRDVWALADLFTSLADNVQETFGLTPLEAMAAGLPVVVSDWNVYRETVRDGLDGILVPTMMSPPGLGGTIAQRHHANLDTYDLTVGALALNVSVDIAAAVEAYAALLADPALRRRMGDSGRERARSVYSWERVYGQYRALWAEQQAIRRAAGPAEVPARPTGTAAVPDPLHLYRHYATATFDESSVVIALAGLPLEAWKVALSSPLLSSGSAGMAGGDDVEWLYRTLTTGPKPVGELMRGAPGRRPWAIQRSVTWLCKAGLVIVQGQVPTARP